ncbi:MAG: sugar phosphate nucleotidyltransferase [Bacteroidetes bacterium]|jgi:glucose-1-phosphate thymidylyltransferase|nr:sugar phosphate nucleotidyltransferase [Bacteroidota bacterium]
MNIIVPMAGRGSRLRPHTLTIPKPLLPVGGKPIVERLVEDIVAMSAEPVEEIAFVIGDFGAETEAQLLAMAERLGAKGHICHQEEPLGTAHAILCGAACLTGPVVVAFADTLFRADFTINPEADGVLFVKQVEDPSAFGVVVTDAQGAIEDYVEKPDDFVSDLAMIGIYAFKDGARLKEELQKLIDHNIIKGGEYQLPDALRNMTQSGLQFEPGRVTEWMDCGNKSATVETNQRILDLTAEQAHVPDSATLIDSTILPPCYIGENVRIERSVIGPHVSIGHGTTIADSRIQNSLIQNHTTIENKVLSGSMVGNHAQLKGRPQDISLGDYNVID